MSDAIQQVNVVGACKAIRDQVAAELDLGDSPTDPITWRYAQEKGTHAVRVRIEAAEQEGAA